MELPPVLHETAGKETAKSVYIQKDNPLAIASLVTGILGWTLVPLLGSIAAIITGHLAKKEINESHGAMQGTSMATAGLIMGYVQLGFIVLAAIIAIIIILIAGANWTA